MQKEAQARIKINKLLEQGWWRFEDNEKWKANVQVETNVKIIWDDFENVKWWFVDYLLLDEKGFPICVLEAKSEDKDPLVGKEQARKYANSLNVRFVILSNGNIHYFWDMEKWNPTRISHFPSLETLKEQKDYKPDINAIINENVWKDYIALTQMPDYFEDPKYKDSSTRNEFIKERWLRFFRAYQLNAIRSIQQAIKEWKNRFLFEMATWTWKTLTSAWVIKLFLKTWIAKRVLFLVDRIELENQAYKAFNNYLWNDYQTVIFKENKDDWRKAEIIVTTIQSISYNNKYLKIFAPSDFDLVISDEAHRSISWSNRLIFEYFLWYKLGLTATPKDYLKNIKDVDDRDPREIEKRQLLSTYETFGCKSWEPTFRYSLLDGVNDPEGPFLVNPTVVNCKTEITTKLLSDEWYAVQVENESWWVDEVVYHWASFERKFFSEKTNREFCRAFMDHALKDPISWEIWKTIFFCVSRKHASKITQILNQLAMEKYPWKYNSDFAVQITSDIPSAQQMTINFANNNLNWYTNFLEWYKSSKTRVCVTVWMMTTWYDCQDLLNICLARPIFSPSDFVQIKWRWTRTYTFEYTNEYGEKIKKDKETFKIFDFFENCEYFEKKYPYDKVIDLPKEYWKEDDWKPVFEEKKKAWTYESWENDYIVKYDEKQIWTEWMRIDREMIGKFESTLKEAVEKNDTLKQALKDWNYGMIEEYVKSNIFDKPKEYFNLQKLRKWYKTDRKIGFWEIIEHIFFWKPFKTKLDLVNEEFEKYIILKWVKPEEFHYVKDFFTYYLLDEQFRTIINQNKLNLLTSNPEIMNMLRKLWKDKIKEIRDYILDNIVINQFYEV